MTYLVLHVCAVGFSSFPFDCQSLLVKVRARGDDASIYRFVPSSSIGDRLAALLKGGHDSAKTISGWHISAIDHKERLYTSKSTFDIFARKSSDSTPNPLYDAIMSTIISPTLAQEMTGNELQSYQTNELNVPNYNNVSETIFSISIKRQPHSYIFNFAVLVALLLGISFSSFLLPNDDMAGRISIALTVCCQAC